MARRISYEWDYETVDEHGDITEHNHRDKFKDFSPDDKTNQLVLVRDEVDEFGSVEDRSWAYVSNNKLPDYFKDANDRATSRVPLKFHKEFERYLNK